MKKKKILQVFNTYTDAYLEYVNNFLTKERFADFFNLDETEVDNLFYAVTECKNNESQWVCLDYYYNRSYNKKYSEKKIHW